MEFRHKRLGIKVQAPDKASAARYFRAMAPIMGGTIMSDIEEVNSPNTHIRGVLLPEKDTDPVISAELRIVAWDSHRGTRFAIVSSPTHELYWVDTNSSILVAKDPKYIPSSRELQDKARRFHERIRRAKRVPEMEFWGLTRNRIRYAHRA